MSQQPRPSFIQRAAALIAPKPAEHESSAADILRRLDSIQQTLAVLDQRPTNQLDAELAELKALLQQPAAPPSEPSAELQPLLAGIEKQLARNGREQLKANALAEAQQEQTQAALELLEEAAARREEQVVALHDSLSEAQSAARLAVVQRVLPALDGIDEALRAGERLLGQSLAARHSTLFERMRARVPATAPQELRLRDALRSWLLGLTFVQQRLLDVLAAEDVRPIASLDLLFDPNLHIVLQVAPADADNAPGLVVAELRRGYMLGRRVLRHAEVAVAQANEREA